MVVVPVKTNTLSIIRRCQNQVAKQETKCETREHVAKQERPTTQYPSLTGECCGRTHGIRVVGDGRGHRDYPVLFVGGNDATCSSVPGDFNDKGCCGGGGACSRQKPVPRRLHH
jgi:hypothetical protein